MLGEFSNNLGAQEYAGLYCSRLALNLHWPHFPRKCHGISIDIHNSYNIWVTTAHKMNFCLGIMNITQHQYLLKSGLLSTKA